MVHLREYEIAEVRAKVLAAARAGNIYERSVLETLVEDIGKLYLNIAGRK